MKKIILLLMLILSSQVYAKQNIVYQGTALSCEEIIGTITSVCIDKYKPIKIIYTYWLHPEIDTDTYVVDFTYADHQFRVQSNHTGVSIGSYLFENEDKKLLAIIYYGDNSASIELIEIINDDIFFLDTKSSDYLYDDSVGEEKPFELTLTENDSSYVLSLAKDDPSQLIYPKSASKLVADPIQNNIKDELFNKSLFSCEYIYSNSDYTCWEKINDLKIKYTYTDISTSIQTSKNYFFYIKYKGTVFNDDSFITKQISNETYLFSNDEKRVFALINYDKFDVLIKLVELDDGKAYLLGNIRQPFLYNKKTGEGEPFYYNLSENENAYILYLTPEEKGAKVIFDKSKRQLLKQVTDYDPELI